jgi:hypothetical protein
MQRNLMPPAPVMPIPEAPLPLSSTIDAAPPDAAPDEESMRERRWRLRAECLAVGIEYSISDNADELEDALRKTRAAVRV